MVQVTVFFHGCPGAAAMIKKYQIDSKKRATVTAVTVCMKRSPLLFIRLHHGKNVFSFFSWISRKAKFD